MRRKRGVWNPPDLKKPLPFFRAYNFEISADLLPSPPSSSLSQSEAGCSDGLQQVRNEFPEIEGPCLSQV